MAIAARTAQTTWEGPLASGTGTVRTGSGAAGELAVTWAARTERAVIGETSDLCPVSRLFAGAKITVDATLEPAP
ncbi:MAG: hypothetical protein ACRDNF_12175 [Streptosporangiaceae bacterium]